MDSPLWEDILEDIAAATGAIGANIVPVSERTKLSVMFTPSLARGFEEYFDHGWNNNDWHLNGLPFLSRYGVVRDLQYTSRDVFERHDFYRFVRKHGLGHAAFVGWHLSAQDKLILAIHRKAGDAPFSVEDEGVLHGLRSRLQDIGRLMQHFLSSRLNGMAEGFDMAGAPAIFFDRFCKVTHINESARLLLGPDLQVTANELRAQRGDDTKKIRRRMQAVMRGQLTDPREGQGPVVVQREGQPPLLLRIQRLGGNLPDIFAAAGVCLLEGGTARSLAEGDVLRARYGLTVQETAIALQLRDGFSIREISEKTSRSYETVRTQVKSIFQKTGVKRQGELLALIGKLGNSAAG